MLLTSLKHQAFDVTKTLGFKCHGDNRHLMSLTRQASDVSEA